MHPAQPHTAWEASLTNLTYLIAICMASSRLGPPCSLCCADVMSAAVPQSSTMRRRPCPNKCCCLCAADVQALAGVYFVLGKVAGFRTAYGVVQGIAVLLSIVRLVDLMAAHQRFAVLPRAPMSVSLLWACMWCSQCGPHAFSGILHTWSVATCQHFTVLPRCAVFSKLLSACIQYTNGGSWP